MRAARAGEVLSLLPLRLTCRTFRPRQRLRLPLRQCSHTRALPSIPSFPCRNSRGARYRAPPHDDAEAYEHSRHDAKRGSRPPSADDQLGGKCQFAIALSEDERAGRVAPVRRRCDVRRQGFAAAPDAVRRPSSRRGRRKPRRLPVAWRSPRGSGLRRRGA